MSWEALQFCLIPIASQVYLASRGPLHGFQMILQTQGCEHLLKFLFQDSKLELALSNQKHSESPFQLMKLVFCLSNSCFFFEYFQYCMCHLCLSSRFEQMILLLGLMFIKLVSSSYIFTYRCILVVTRTLIEYQTHFNSQ